MRLVCAGALTAGLLVGGATTAAQAAVGTHSYTVTATLDGRTAKDLSNHAYPNKYASGSTVAITCQDSGPNAYGSTVWDRTSDHLWIPDYYVKTGHSSFTDELPRCINSEAPGSGRGHPFPARATLDGRTVKDLSNHAYPNKYPNGSTIWVTCQDGGPSAYGSSIWDYTSDNLWVPDYYVGTGTSGFFGKDVPRCGDDEPTGSGSSAGPRSFPARATLDGRTAKDLNNHAFPNRYPQGSSVLISCQTSGPDAYGSTVWDLTGDGLWVADYYIATGSTGYSSLLPRCPASHSYSVSATLDGRTAKDVSNHAYPDRYPAGSTVSITCQAYGGATYGGSSLWDYTAEHLWVADYYVKTGTDGRVADLPRCDATAPAGESNPAPPSGSPAPPSTQQGKVQAAIAAARAEITNHPLYTWGGGHGARPGASRGYCDGVNGYLNGVCAADQRIGFDCSGLMRWSFYQATGSDWGNLGTSSLYKNRPSIFGSTIIDLNYLQPGDLILSDPGHEGHVHHTLIVSAVNGSTITVIEAPRTSIPLRETTFDKSSFLKAYRLS